MLRRRVITRVSINWPLGSFGRCMAPAGHDGDENIRERLPADGTLLRVRSGAKRRRTGVRFPRARAPTTCAARAARAVPARIDNSKAAAGVHSLRSVVYWPPGDHVAGECPPPVAAFESRASRVACPAFFVASNIRTSAGYCRRLDKNTCLNNIVSPS